MTRIGSRVGHFLVVRPLGRGGMGEVFEGFDETLQRRVALKTIRADRRLDESARNRFVREARMLSQLDHPSICRIFDYVEGADADLLVLEFIEGRTLRSAIRHGLEPRERIRVAAAVAGALAAAHRLGIIHRDLKPENVMLTPDGTVKVLDFGLARSIAETPAAAQPPESPGSVSDFDQQADEEGETLALRRSPSPHPVSSGTDTRVGETVGTPAYMSPEQARGEVLTTASDMYSFGLLLQALFTGRDAHPDFLTPPLLLERASRAESNPVSGVDRDVAALINSLKVLAPSDRPTAHDAVERLEWIAHRPRRRMRRLAAAAVVLMVLAGSTKYVVDVRRERNVAVSARADAERRRGQAEELIGFMVGDLRTKLTKVGRLDVLDDVGGQALRYFNSLRPEEISAGELRRNAKTLSQIGEVRMQQGNLAGAEEVLRSSLSLAMAAAARDAGDAENQLELGASHFWMGSLYRQQGDLSRGLDHYRKYLQIGERLAARDPRNATYQIEVGYGHSNVGTILEQQGKLEDALAHYGDAVAIIERRLTSEPTRNDLRRELATAVNKVGVVLLSLGRYAEAERALGREKELLFAVLHADPRDVRTKFRLAVNLSYLGRLHDETGADALAMASYSEERELVLQLVAHDESNTSWQRAVAVADTKVGRLLFQGGDRAAAEAAYRRAFARLEPLVKHDPSRIVWRRDLANVHEATALAMIERSTREDAGRQIEMARSLIAVAPLDDPETQRIRWQTAVTAGLVAARAGDEKTARKEWMSVVDALWASRSELRDIREIDLLARALLHLERAEDAAPLVARLSNSGYRKRPLMSLWDMKRSRKGERNAYRHRQLHTGQSSAAIPL